MLLFILFFLINGTFSLDITIGDSISIQNTTSAIAKGLMNYYTGSEYGNPVGMFSAPYYWWQSGAAWGSMLDYWFYTGDDQYNEVLKQALLAQVGENWDFVPINQSTTEGNDDQAFWGLTVMSAAERNFSNPEPGQPQWLYLAQAVFNTMSSRWDEPHCGGGLRWQIFQWNSGYDYKNTVSNGSFFLLGARLARYLDNATYVAWCETVWDWLESAGLLKNSDGYMSVYDGVKVEENCSHSVHLQWTYNAGLMLAGCAYLADYTQDPVWHNRVNVLLNGLKVFFRADIMWEAACEGHRSCNNDQRSFKAYLSRFLGLTAHLITETREAID
jgi:mannan endo-1,6-alpha-mannosidase